MSGVGVLVDARARWEAFRREHGNTGWVGNPPRYELYQELLDGLNYCDEDARQNGRDPDLAYVRALLLEAATIVREKLERG
jgi:hypothetical protein